MSANITSSDIAEALLKSLQKDEPIGEQMTTSHEHAREVIGAALVKAIERGYIHSDLSVLAVSVANALKVGMTEFERSGTQVIPTTDSAP